MGKDKIVEKPRKGSFIVPLIYGNGYEVDLGSETGCIFFAKKATSMEKCLRNMGLGLLVAIILMNFFLFRKGIYLTLTLVT